MKHGNRGVNRNFINLHGGFSAMSDYRGVTQTDSKICTSPKEVGFPTVGSNRFDPTLEINGTAKKALRKLVGSRCLNAHSLS